MRSPIPMIGERGYHVIVMNVGYVCVCVCVCVYICESRKDDPYALWYLFEKLIPVVE